MVGAEEALVDLMLKVVYLPSFDLKEEEEEEEAGLLLLLLLPSVECRFAKQLEVEGLLAIVFLVLMMEPLLLRVVVLAVLILSVLVS
jgi:hypothetical protein